MLLCCYACCFLYLLVSVCLCVIPCVVFIMLFETHRRVTHLKESKDLELSVWRVDNEHAASQLSPKRDAEAVASPPGLEEMPQMPEIAGG